MRDLTYCWPRLTAPQYHKPRSDAILPHHQWLWPGFFFPIFYALCTEMHYYSEALTKAL